LIIPDLLRFKSQSDKTGQINKEREKNLPVDGINGPVRSVVPPPDHSPDQDHHQAGIRGTQGHQKSRIRTPVQPPSLQLILQLEILRQEPRQLPLESGAVRNTVLYNRVSYKLYFSNQGMGEQYFHCTRCTPKEPD
jgi:hypothetical protein